MSEFKDRIKVHTDDEKRIECINILDTIVILTPSPEKLQRFGRKCPEVLTEVEFKAIYEIAKTIITMDKSHDIYIRLIDYLGINKRYENEDGRILRLVRTCIRDMEDTQGNEWVFNPEKILNIINREDKQNVPTVKIAEEATPKVPGDD